MEDENSCFRVRFSVEKETLKKKLYKTRYPKLLNIFVFLFTKYLKNIFRELYYFFELESWGRVSHSTTTARPSFPSDTKNRSAQGASEEKVWKRNQRENCPLNAWNILLCPERTSFTEFIADENPNYGGEPSLLGVFRRKKKANKHSNI